MVTPPHRTELRHQMLREIDESRGNLVLECKNIKQGLWKPVRLDRVGLRINITAGESRAINDLLWDYADTPAWQGDMGVYRVVELTDAGRKLLAAWDRIELIP